MGVCILGIGDCDSKSTSTTTNYTSNNVAIDNSVKSRLQQDCDSTISQSNELNIIGSTVKKLNANQMNSMKSLCVMKSVLESNINTDISNQLLNDIKKNLKTEGAMLGSTASNDTVVENISKTNVNIDNAKTKDIIKNCIIGVDQSNLLNIIGSSVEASNIDQANESFMECLSEHSDLTGVTSSSLSDTKNKEDTTQEASGGDVGKSVGSVLSGFGGMLGAGSLPLIVLSIVIGCVCFSSILMIVLI